jgi:hypothetical protein
MKNKEIFVLIIISILFFSCNKIKQIHDIVENKNKITESNVFESAISTTFPIEKKGFQYQDSHFSYTCDAGTFLITNIIDNNVNVRNYPSLDSKIIYKLQNNDAIQIIGSSGDKMNIDSFNGNWLNILYQKSEKECINGWVFSKYVNIETFEYTPIKFSKFEQSKYSDYKMMYISYSLHGKEILDVPDYSEWNNYYIIVWGPYDNNFHYSNKPGVYLMDKETYELEHITYIGSFGATAHAWTIFTDDFQYLIQDSGTNAGIRGVTAWLWKDLEEVFSGIYYRDINLTNNIIEVVFRYNDWSFKHGYTDEEIMIYGKKYKEETPIPQEIIETEENTDLTIELIIRCSFNLDTGERKILGGEYILEQ